MPFRVSASGIVSYAAPKQFTGFIHAGTWADESRVERLKELWAKGYSASVIATELGGTTRNAVISKANRLGLPGRHTVSTVRRVRRASAPKPPAFPRPHKAPGKLRPARTATPVLDALLIPLDQLTSETCHWPVDGPDGRVAGYCGHQRTGRQPYCNHHQAIGHKQEC
jgi:GcrA cell cycle regulator